MKRFSSAALLLLQLCHSDALRVGNEDATAVGFDCSIDRRLWAKAWSEEKQQYCCDEIGVGCKDHSVPVLAEDSTSASGKPKGGKGKKQAEKKQKDEAAMKPKSVNQKLAEASKQAAQEEQEKVRQLDELEEFMQSKKRQEEQSNPTAAEMSKSNKQGDPDEVALKRRIEEIADPESAALKKKIAATKDPSKSGELKQHLAEIADPAKEAALMKKVGAIDDPDKVKDLRAKLGELGSQAKANEKIAANQKKGDGSKGGKP